VKLRSDRILTLFKEDSKKIILKIKNKKNLKFKKFKKINFFFRWPITMVGPCGESSIDFSLYPV
jgi:hypothetical protein